MRKFFLGLLGTVGVLAIAGYLFRAPLMEFAMEKITANMFVAADTDDFDPGIAIGERFPPLHTLFRGQGLTDTSPFIGDKGMIFIANRSVDW
jgi:hypothetical protein